MKSWAPGRVQEFVGARACAEESLKHFKIQQAIILKSDSGAPIWPSNIVGSLSHSKNTAMSISVGADKFHGVGLDIETIIHDDRRETISKKVTRQEDEALLLNYKDTINEIMTLIFSAKESLYKCINPITNIFFGFEHAYLNQIDIESRKFSIVLDSSIPELKNYNGQYNGHFEFLGDSIVTLVAIAKA
jgi:4'-phosphopantetheinyl transferase EntD